MTDFPAHLEPLRMVLIKACTEGTDNDIGAARDALVDLYLENGKVDLAEWWRGLPLSWLRGFAANGQKVTPAEITK